MMVVTLHCSGTNFLLEKCVNLSISLVFYVYIYIQYTWIYADNMCLRYCYFEQTALPAFIIKIKS